MRIRLVALLAVVAALVACVNATGAPEARAVTYLFHAEFGIRYEVDWTEETSDQVTDCATWKVDRGTLEVVVGSTKPMRGSLNLFGRYSKNLR